MRRGAMDFAVRLRGLGLGQYEEKCRENKIDTDVLPRLTADDLKDIGVPSGGERRKPRRPRRVAGCLPATIVMYHGANPPWRP
jgi:hypothetical protein